MVRTGNVDFSCKRLTSIEIRKSKYHIIRRVRFRWDPPLRKISGSALEHLLTPLGNKPFENTVGKGEIAHNEQYLLFPLCFLPVWITFFHFRQI